MNNDNTVCEGGLGQFTDLRVEGVGGSLEKKRAGGVFEGGYPMYTMNGVVISTVVNDRIHVLFP